MFPNEGLGSVAALTAHMGKHRHGWTPQISDFDVFPAVEFMEKPPNISK